MQNKKGPVRVPFRSNIKLLRGKIREKRKNSKRKSLETLVASRLFFGARYRTRIAIFVFYLVLLNTIFPYVSTVCVDTLFYLVPSKTIKY